jgi:hypothetical protein
VTVMESWTCRRCRTIVEWDSDTRLEASMILEDHLEEHAADRPALRRRDYWYMGAAMTLLLAFVLVMVFAAWRAVTGA